MSVHLKLLSGDILTFSIFEGYKFSNLRSEFYELMSENLSIRELECISIFDNNDEYNFQVDLTHEVTEGNIYNVFVNQIVVRIVFDDNSRKVKFEHDYQNFPNNTIIQITSSVQDNYEESYQYMYNYLDKCFQEDFENYNMEYDPDNYIDYYNRRNESLRCFKDYINNFNCCWYSIFYILFIYSKYNRSYSI